jgi:hypothetical protein
LAFSKRKPEGLAERRELIVVLGEGIRTDVATVLMLCFFSSICCKLIRVADC